jgi:hypothetical protein
MPMPTLGVSQLKPAHESAHLTELRRPNKKMEVVRHDAIREQRNACALASLLDDLEEGFVVRRLDEQLGSPCGAVHDVKDNVGGVTVVALGHDRM